MRISWNIYVYKNDKYLFDRNSGKKTFTRGAVDCAVVRYCGETAP